MDLERELHYEEEGFKQFDDEYLRIDLSEEEENLFSVEPVEGTVTVESQTNGKANEKEEASYLQNANVEKDKFIGTITLSKNSDCLKVKNVQKKKCQLKSQLKKKKTKTQSLDHCLPEEKLSVGQNELKQSLLSLCNSQRMRFSQGFGSNQNSVSGPFLNLNAVNNGKSLQQRKRFRHLHTFRLNCPSRFPVPCHTVSQQIDEPFVYHSTSAFNNDQSEFQENKKLYRNLTCTDIDSKVMLQNAYVKKNGHFDRNFDASTKIDPKGLSNDFRITGRSEDCKQPAFYDQKNCGVGTNVNFNVFGVSHYETNIKNVSLVGRSNLLQSEEKFTQLKKKALLKHVTHDIVRKDRKIVNSNSEKGSNGEGEIFHLEQHFEEEGSHDGQDNLLKLKPVISKELLLKKKNPFDTKVEMSGTPTTEVKEECVQNTFLNSDIVHQRLKEASTLSTSESVCQGLYVVKVDTDSDVKFVRTVSKSFDELTHKNGFPSLLSQSCKTFPFVQGSLKKSSPTKDSTQIEPQLTGCIVKVLNIPPSTTVNDILDLCSPIGSVMEIKLNLPKENSVVIRFAEPKSADMFFSLYHGQKMNNSFLYAIIV